MNLKIYIFISLAILGLITSRLLYVIYLEAPRPTYRLQEPPKLLTYEVKAGEYVKWQSDICKLHDKEFRTERILKNLDTKREIELEATINRPPGNLPPLKKGECRINDASQLIPEEILPGQYEIVTNVYVKSTNRSIDKFEYSVGPFTIK